MKFIIPRDEESVGYDKLASVFSEYESSSEVQPRTDLQDRACKGDAIAFEDLNCACSRSTCVVRCGFDLFGRPLLPIHGCQIPGWLPEKIREILI
jgi:hypothetical protein